MLKQLVILNNSINGKNVRIIRLITNILTRLNQINMHIVLKGFVLFVMTLWHYRQSTNTGRDCVSEREYNHRKYSGELYWTRINALSSQRNIFNKVTYNNFLQPPRPSLGSSQPSINGYRVPFPEVKPSGLGVNHPPLHSAWFKKE